MSFSLKNFLFIGVLLLIISTQGVLTFNLFKLLGGEAWKIKSFVQPFSLAIILFYFMVAKVLTGHLKISQVDILLFFYFAICSVFLYQNATGIESGYIAFREVFLLFLLIYIFNQVKISYKQWNVILKIILILVFLNIFFTILVFFVGWSEYTRILVGESFWGIHEDFKFKFSDFTGVSFIKLYRVPALVGESAALGHLGLISFFLLKDHKKYKYLSYISLVLVALCFTRSVYLVLIVYYLLLGMSSSKRFQKFVLYGLLLIPILIVVLLRYGLFDIKSLYMRFDFWNELMEIDFNFIYGGAIGSVGLASAMDGFINVIDNYWLFLIFSIGIIGVVLVIFFFYEKTRYKKDLAFITIAFLISGLFITLTQSLVFLSLYPLLFLNYRILEDERNRKV